MPLRVFARRDGSGTLLIAAYPRESAGAAPSDAGSAEIRPTRFFQTAPFGIGTIGADGRLVASNAAFARMIPDGAVSAGMGAVEVLCRSASPETQRIVDEGLKQALAGTASLTPIDITVGPRNEVSLSLYVVPLTQGEGYPRSRRPLSHRRHRAEGARSQVRAVVENGSGRQARRRHRPRLQQRADGHHRLLGSAAADPPAYRPGLQGHQEHPAERLPCRRHGAPAPRLLAPPDAGDRDPAARRSHHRHVVHAEDVGRREDRVQEPDQPRPLVRQGRPHAGQPGGAQPRRQRPRRHAGRRHSHGAHAQHHRARVPEAGYARACPSANTC